MRSSLSDAQIPCSVRASPPADAAGSLGVCGMLVHTRVMGEIGKVCSRGPRISDDRGAMMVWDGELQFWEDLGAADTGSKGACFLVGRDGGSRCL